MKKIIIPLLLCLISITTFAQAPEYVYITPNGSVWHSTPSCRYLARSKVVNKVKYESVSDRRPCSCCGSVVTEGNQKEPETTVEKTSPKPKTTASSGTYNGRTVYTGPRGGRYYINSSGRKVYIKR